MGRTQCRVKDGKGWCPTGANKKGSLVVGEDFKIDSEDGPVEVHLFTRDRNKVRRFFITAVSIMRDIL